MPWSERLADYQALQAELAKQAAEEAEEENVIDEEEDLAVLDSEQGEDTKQ